MSFGDLLYQGQTEAITVYLGINYFLRSVKRLKDRTKIFFRDADTVILDTYFYFAASVFSRNAQPRISVAVFDGIYNQILYRLAQGYFVSIDRWQCRRDRSLDCQVVLIDQRPAFV